MYPNVKAIWTKALLSAEYGQTKHTLTRVNPETGKVSHCCLGVLTEEAIKAGVVLGVVDTEHGFRFYDNESSVLPDAVMEWAGIDPQKESSNPTIGKDDAGNWVSAAEANDSLDMTFAEIADLIDANL